MFDLYVATLTKDQQKLAHSTFMQCIAKVPKEPDLQFFCVDPKVGFDGSWAWKLELAFRPDG